MVFFNSKDLRVTVGDVCQTDNRFSVKVHVRLVQDILDDILSNNAFASLYSFFTVFPEEDFSKEFFFSVRVAKSTGKVSQKDVKQRAINRDKALGKLKEMVSYGKLELLVGQVVKELQMVDPRG